MRFDAIIEDVRAKKLVGIRFQREGQGKYRDRITVYRDGGLFFERFCYGEAAGLVLSMKGKAGDKIVWDYNTCAHSLRVEAPAELTDYINGELFFDGKKAAWQAKEQLKSDMQNGYSRLSAIFGK